MLPATAHAEILIGVAGPLTGPNAAVGNELKAGTAAAIAAINAEGGINSEPLKLIEGDDGCDAKRALDVAKSFASQDVRLVVGHFCTYASLAAAPTYAGVGILMISPASTAPALTSSKLWNVFRLTGREDLQADVAAARIKADGDAPEVVVVSDQSADLAPLVKRFLSAMPNAKLFTVKTGSARLPEDPAFLTATAAYLALQASDGGAIAADLRKLNPSITLYGPDSLQSETFATKAGDAANGTRVSFLDDLQSRADPKRQVSLIISEGSTLSAYAAVESFAAAAKARGVNNSRAMANWLTGGNEINTIIGPIAFTATGDLKKQPYMWLQWQDGEMKLDKTTQ
jgi:branched-chain amino acid transport system substrate-binding protein